MNEVEEMNGMLRASLVLFEFRVPFMKDAVDFEKCFHSSSGDEISHAFVVNLTAARERVRSVLNETGIRALEKSSAFDEYLPLLWQLFDSLERQPPVRLDSDLKFTWKGSVTNAKNPTSFRHILFELIMTLHAKAICLANAAMELAKSDAGSVNSAAKYLREASGVMAFLSTGVIPRWQAVAYAELKPPECSPEHTKFLADYLEGCSHQMVVAKALQASPPASLMTSLCLNVVRSMEFSLDILHRYAASDIPRTDPSLAVHIATQREFFSAMVYAYQAEDMVSKTETGNAIALCAVSLSKLQERSTKVFDPLTPGLPRSKDQSAALKAGVVTLFEKVSAMRAKAESENRMIYFKSVPRDMADLPELPAPTSLSLPTSMYEQPNTEIIMFKFDPKRKKTVFNAFAAMFSSSSSSSSAAPSDETESSSAASATAPPSQEQAASNVLSPAQTNSAPSLGAYSSGPSSAPPPPPPPSMI